MMLLAWTIASPTGQSDRLFSDVAPILLLLVGVVVVGGLLIYAVRRSLRSDVADPDQGFTLHDLRTLHSTGQLSDQEFEKAKAAMIDHLRRAKPSSGPKGDAAKRDR